VAVAIMLTVTPTIARAQIATSPPPQGAQANTMAPGARYTVGGLKRWLYGSDYRSLWATPIQVPVLNMDSVGGGLTPSRTGGFGQSISLHFNGSDGRRYVVRSVDKDPTRRLLPQLKGTFIESIVQDQISALLPTGALVVDPLLETTGVLHAKHQLVVIPDDPRLGEFRSDYAGLLGMLVLHPDEGADDTPGFAGSRRISGTDAFLEALENSPCDRVDSRTYLKARFLDMLIGDRDRHADQWRWASFPRGECRTWVPIPEDRDQAFVSYDGLVMWITRRSRPQQIKFESDYPSITGLTFNGWEIDRELLVELEQPVWDSVAQVIQRELTEEVIEDAVGNLPPPHYDIVGEFLVGALKDRRDQLDEAAAEYYRLITRWPDIKATDEAEYAELEHSESGELEVRIGLLDGAGGGRAAPYFSRTFDPDHTKEVRLFMRGGDDQIEVLGASGRIRLRIDGGAGDDRFLNSSRTGSGKTRFYDFRGDNEFEAGTGANVNQRAYARPPAKDLAHRFALDWGGRRLTAPRLAYAPDPGVFLAAEVNFERYGFRKDPYKTRHRIMAGLVTNGPEPMLGYEGSFRHVWPKLDVETRLAYTGLLFLRFNGFGNATEIPGSTDFYRVQQRTAVIAPSIAFRTGRNRGEQTGSGTEPLREELTVDLSLLLKYWDTPLDDNADNFIGAFDPPLYGTGAFGELGARIGLELDTRDNSGNPKAGLLIKAGAALFPEVWDVASTFGQVNGALSVYLTPHIPTDPTLALRVGGKKVWGSPPYQEAAYLGGGGNLRGYRSHRYAGNAAVYGNAELRFSVAPFKVLVPGTFGLFGLTDVGRVYYENDPDDADDWHVGYGGGFWISIIDRLQTLSVAIAKGDDLTGLYIRAGFMF
jgi:hypothetical protein